MFMLLDISAQSLSLPVFKLNTEDRPLLDYSSAFGILLHLDVRFGKLSCFIGETPILGASVLSELR